MTEEERRKAWAARMVQWWADWRAADYTWDGLDKLDDEDEPDKPWRGWVWSESRQEAYETDQAPKRLKTRPASLQHYWITQFRKQGLDPEACLISNPATSETYSLVHLPTEWADGSPTAPMARPDDALAVINACLADTGETSFDGNWFPTPAGTDRRAQLQGAIIPGSPTPGTGPDGTPVLRADFSRCCFLDRVDWSSAEGAPRLAIDHAVFRSAAFSGYANFRSAAFSRYANFRSAAFSRYAVFRSAAFSGDADFNSAAFSGNANFRSAAFSGDAVFNSAAFSRYAVFRSAAFSGDAVFRSAAFCGQLFLDHAHFESAAIFAGAAETTSREPASQPLILTPPEQSQASRDWSGRLDTVAAVLPAAHRSFGGLSAQSAVFVGDLDMTNRAFLSPSSFEGAHFLGLVAFHGARLHQRTGWHRSRIATLNYLTARKRPWWTFIAFDIRTLAWLRLPMAAVARRRFLKARKAWRVQHDRLWRTGEWRVGPDPVPTRVSGETPRFASYRDGDTAWWRPQPQPQARYGWPPPSLVLLDAQRRIAALSDPEIKARSELNPEAHQAVLDAWRAQTDAARRRRRPLPTDRNFEAAEAAFRTLKQGMEDIRARLSEGRFFRLELKARRERYDDEVQAWERAFSRAYGALADYGNSVTRPLAWLTGVFIAFGLIYWIWEARTTGLPAFGLGPPDPDLWQALRFSGSRMLPFGALGGDDAWPWRASLLAGETNAVFVRFVATAQSLIATVLTFLFALAVRRRFQIT